MRNWKALYRAAIFEKNRSVVLRKISDAEKAVLSRGRELLRNSGTLEEKDEIEDALYALRAYRTACEQLDEMA